MNNHQLIKLIVTAVASVFFISIVNAGEAQAVEYKFAGNSLTRSVCKSIVDNDASKLKRLLRREQTVTRSFCTIDSKILCNNKNLYDFALDLNADESRELLVAMDKFKGTFRATEADQNIVSR